MSQNLKSRTINGLAWNLIDKMGQQALFFASGIFLARILNTRDFGLLGMISIFTVLSGILIDSGFGLSLVKKEHPSQIEYTSVFYFNLGVSLVLYSILFFTAPFIADFYNEPELTNLCRVTFLAIIFNALVLVQIVQLIKDIDFKISTIINLIALVLAGIISVFLAYSGYGVWALVIQAVSISFFKCILLWLTSKWKPSLQFSFKAIKEMFPFGVKTVIASLINGIYNNIYSLLIGRYFSVSEVGYYTQANKFQSIPVGLIDSTFRGVSVSVISTINNDIPRMKRVLSKNIKTIAFLIFPMMMILIVFAKPIIQILISEKWLFSVEYLQILSIAGITLPFISVFNDFCNMNHRSDLFLKLEIIKKIFLTLLIICAIPLGVKAMTWAWVGYGILSTIVSVQIAGKLVKYNLKDFIKDVSFPMISSILLGIIGALILFKIENQLVGLLVGILFFTTGYSIISLLLRIESAIELKVIFSDVLNKVLKMKL